MIPVPTPNKLLLCSGSLDGGGSERQLWQLATQIDSSSFAPQVYLLYRRGIYLEKLPASVPVETYWSSDNQERPSLPGTIFYRQAAHLTRHIREQQIDLLYDRTFHMTLLTAAACRRTRIPRVSVIVSPPSHDFVRSRERFRWFKFKRLQNAYRDPRALTIAVSEGTAEDAAAFYSLDRSRMVVVPSPIDVEAVKTAAQAATTNELFGGNSDRNALVGSERPFRIVIVARMSAEKGYSLFLQSLPNVIANLAPRHVRIDLIGDGPEKSKLLQLIDQLEINSYVHVHGFLTNPYPWMKQADCVVVPSDYEGLPNVVLEAGVLQTPVIATRCSDSLVDLLGAKQERGLVVPVGDAESLGQAIISVAREPELSKRRAEKAYQWVSEKHSMPHWIATMQNIFAQQLSKFRNTV